MENKDGGVPGTGAPAAAAAEVPPAVEVREQDQLMPITNVNRIMRRVLPPHAKISDDAKELVQECTSEFISFLTGEANEQCHKECRKTISAHDILWALRSLGFNDYIQPVTAYLNRMRDIENGVVVVNPLPTGPRPPPLPPSAAGSSQGLMQQMQMQMLMQMQMQLGGAMYAPRPPAPVQQQHYAIPAMPMRVRPPFVGGQQGAVFRGNQPMAPYYGGEHLAYGEGSSRGAGDVGDEGSSSN